MQGRSADAERIVQVLVRAGTEAIQRDGETPYAQRGHGGSSHS